MAKVRYKMSQEEPESLSRHGREPLKTSRVRLVYRQLECGGSACY